MKSKMDITQKNQCQPVRCVIIPPSIGPSAGPMGGGLAGFQWRKKAVAPSNGTKVEISHVILVSTCHSKLALRSMVKLKVGHRMKCLTHGIFSTSGKSTQQTGNDYHTSQTQLFLSLVPF
jgi:hypothetical protein